MKRFLSLFLALVLCLCLIPVQAKAVQGGKLIAITFDDGPSSYNTSRLLDGLKARGVKVTFFCQGSAANANLSLVERAYAEGHEIANHSWDHPELTTISDERILSQLSRTEAVFDKICGSNAEYLLRPPYGSTNEHVRSLFNMPVIIWSVDTMDWDLLNTYSVRDVILEEAYDGAIVLLHDIHSTSVDGALLAIDKLLERGYELVTVSELYRRRGQTLEDGVRYYDCRNNGIDLGPIPTPKISYTTDKKTMEITLTADTDAPIYYTTDGTIPNSDSPVYTGPFTVPYPCNVRAVAAYQMNGSRSDMAILAYGMTPCEAPVISTKDGVMTLTCATEDADIYYTLDNTTATTKSTLYTGPVAISGDQYIHAVSGGGFFKTSKEVALYCSPRFNLFSDIKPGDWYMDAIDRVVEAGLMNGVGAYQAAPNSKLTRAMLVTMLYRYSGDDLGDNWKPSHSFKDVPSDQYYAEAVEWAYNRGIINGYSATRFGPNSNLTRQEMCKVIDYYLITSGNRLPVGESCEEMFADYYRIASWALDSVEAMVSAGLIYGDGKNMNPTGTATRAEVATILARVMDYEAACAAEAARFLYK